jgi:hypothetical protein
MATVTDRNAKRFRVPTSACRLLVTGFLLFALAHEVLAQTNMVERNVNASPGRDVRVGIYTSIGPDCTSGPLPAIRLANAPAHGSVTVKRAMLKATNFKQCLAIDVPAFVAFYHSAPDFSGADEFLLEVTFAGGRREMQDFRVTVSSAANGGQGI